MSKGAEVSSGDMSWCVVSKPDRHPRVVVKFKSRSGKTESKTERMDPGSMATVRTARWRPHWKRPNRQEARDRVVPGRWFSKCSEDLTKWGRQDAAEEEGGQAG